MSGVPESVTAGNSLRVTVTVLDTLGNPATGYTGTVHFTSNDVAATLPADYSFTSTDAGAHSFLAILYTAGSRTITATDTGMATLTATANLNVTPGAMSTLLVAGLPSLTTAGDSHTVTVTARDFFGNVVTGYAGTLHFSSSDPAAALPADYSFTSADAGTHSFDGVVLKTAGAHSFNVFDAAILTLGASRGVSVSPAAAAVLFLSGIPERVSAGNSFGVTVTAKDAYGNSATGYTGMLHFSSSDPAAALPADYSFTGADAGVHVFHATLTRQALSRSLPPTRRPRLWPARPAPPWQACLYPPSGRRAEYQPGVGTTSGNWATARRPAA